MAEKKFSLADQLYNADKVAYLGGLFRDADAGFDADAFHAQVMTRLHDFELKQRAIWITECLEPHLPSDFPAAAAAIHAMLPPPLDPTLSDDDFGDFIFSPLAIYVERNGMDAAHLDTALTLLHALTQRFSVEFSIRPFLNTYPDQVMAALATWARDDNYHVRRLVSEGTRPKLPWGQKIGLAPTDPLPLLDLLHGDKTRYVTRSVANHLNDIAKIDPAIVLNRLAAWQAKGAQDAAEMDWITRHALRGLIKAGHADAMAMLGYAADAPVDCDLTVDPATCAIGDTVTLRATITAATEQPVLVDYVIDRLLANGKTGRKVGKWAEKVVTPGAPLVLEKKVKFVKGATTISYNPGPHPIHLQVNGVLRASTQVDLTA
ncbi:hypothetical protein ACMU_12640 [Actibacterium mucosum KCTC 23349]|uniref:DNA alkylation repair protein n=1 Tax=Actibacterium mucosum KCTC 23349 TaxID=1454373 RepID=A0A037ZGF9_9RHOB|nr:hypothetical protein [Actibacterium mucosum]KAJ55535.1 hypothetical protein ACMU_12640 [Actibacterium mucosum KCTC 23349]